MAARSDEVWKRPDLVAVFLEGVRGAIPLAQEQIDVMLRLLASSGKPIGRFLDLGCGDGVLASAIVDRRSQAAAVLMDFSEPMLDAARRRLAGHAEAYFVNADYALPTWTQDIAQFAPFDAVVSGYSIHHQPDERKREVYSEIFGLLEPGGVFLNVEHVSSASPWVESVHDDLFVDHLMHAHTGRPRAEVAANYYHRPDKAANILAPVELQCQWLREIGFTDVDCYLKVFELAVFGGRRP
jgi:ubiquinone/menaquinone biosynthesis C-methylase UbiE